MWQRITAHVQQLHKLPQHPQHLWANDIINMKTPLIFFAVDYDVAATFYASFYSFFPNSCTEIFPSLARTYFSVYFHLPLFFFFFWLTSAYEKARLGKGAQNPQPFLTLYFHFSIMYLIYLHATHAVAVKKLGREIWDSSGAAASLLPEEQAFGPSQVLKVFWCLTIFSN